MEYDCINDGCLTIPECDSCLSTCININGAQQTPQYKPVTYREQRTCIENCLNGSTVGCGGEKRRVPNWHSSAVTITDVVGRTCSRQPPGVPSAYLNVPMVPILNVWQQAGSLSAIEI